MSRPLLVGGLILCTSGVTTLAAPPVGASTITVTTTVDELNSDGDCSLREAVEAANTDAAVDACSAGNGNDTITVGPGDYQLASALVASDAAGLTIEGAGSDATTIWGSGLDRIVEVDDGPFVARSVHLSNGFMISGHGGAISTTDDPVTIEDSSVSDNTAGSGGGIASESGTVTIVGSLFQYNFTTADHATDDGGAVFTESADIVVRTSTFIYNGASHVGGGFATSSGSIEVERSTFLQNWADAGGAMFDDSSTIDLLNTTLDRNGAAGVVTEGALQTGDAGAITLRQVTLTDSQGAGIKSDGAVDLTNTIIVGGSAGQACSITSTITSHGGNLSGDRSCILDDPTDVVADPNLAPLADNGGPTQTRLPRAGSLAIDGGVSAGCAAADQRGVSRPQDGNGDGSSLCDRGAVELAGLPAPPTDPATPVPAAPAFTG